MGLGTSHVKKREYEPVDSLTNCSLEAELKKAEALAYWRKWNVL